MKEASEPCQEKDDQCKMDESSVSPKSANGDPYRHRRRRRKNDGREEPGLKKRLESVEEELEESRNEIKQLKIKLELAEKERKELMGTMSSLYVQVQYWNSWLGKFSTELHDKGIKDLNMEQDKNNGIGDSAEDNINSHEVAKEVNNVSKNYASIADKNEVLSNTDGKQVEINKQKGEGENDTKESNSVANMLKETAENAFADSGMAYDENSGLYYDWNSHMYYDPNTHLFYDNDNGIYYYYDSTKGSYVFYSQVNVNSPNDTNVDIPSNVQDKSEGELSSTDNETEPEMVSCIRAIITAAETIKIGTLYLVTCAGATIGRDKNHVFHVPDKDVSKNHASIKYEEKDGTYMIKDDGSVNGSFLNDKRLSESKHDSKWFPIKHKDFLKIGSTVFVLHLHRGQETCDDCEPGQVQALLSAIDSKSPEVDYSTLTKEELRKKQLKGLKEKYMVSGDGLKQALKPITSGKYKDRAIKRRRNIGSEAIKDDRQMKMEEKSSVRKMISGENKGHQMMQKMGWKIGEGLGKEGSGIKEPIHVVIREKNKGLGSGSLHSIDDAPHQKSVNQKWKKAKERYDNIVQDEKDLNYGTEISNEKDFDF